MAFLNTLGRVSRLGQWRFRHVFRVSDATGRIDQSDNGLFAFGEADVRLTLSPRPPLVARLCWDACAPADRAVLAASRSAGSLGVYDPGHIEAVFPAGWSQHIPPGLYDLRIAVTVDAATAILLDQPIDLV